MNSFPNGIPNPRQNHMNNHIYMQQDPSMIQSNNNGQFSNSSNEQGNHNRIYNHTSPQYHHYPSLPAGSNPSSLYNNKRHTSLPQCSPGYRAQMASRSSTPPLLSPSIISTSDGSGSDEPRSGGRFNSVSYNENSVYSINNRIQNNHIQRFVHPVVPRFQNTTHSSTYRSEYKNTFLPPSTQHNINSSVPSHQYYTRIGSSSSSYHNCLPNLPFISSAATCIEVNNNSYDEKHKRPQSFRDDPSRRARVKTELCERFKRGEVCPFGDKCSFAHGVEELKLKKLYDLQSANLEDISWFRTRPCFDFVSTGSCPFTSRCKCIHDPRLIGETSFWLPHSEMKVSNLPTDVNVNNLHHMRLQWHHYGSPFGSLFKHINNNIKEGGDNDFEKEWKILHNQVCNIKTKNNNDKMMDNNNRTNNISASSKYSSLKMRMFQNNRHSYFESSSSRIIINEYLKIEIALKMLPSKDEYYTFQPSHIIYNEMCMIIQTRAFRIPIKHTSNTTDSIMEINVNKCNNNSNHQFHNHTNEKYHNVIVREIAFGSLMDDSVRRAALWFDIPNHDISECTPQQTKRRKRTMKRLKQQQVKVTTDMRSCLSSSSSNSSTSSFQYSSRNRIMSSPSNRSSIISKYNIASFDEFPVQPFYLMYVLGDDAYKLVKEILKYQLKLYQHEQQKKKSVSIIRKTQEKVLPNLDMDSELKKLKIRFVNLMRHWKKWSWQINKGREEVNEDTNVPDVDGEYHFPSDDNNPNSFSTHFNKNNYCNSIWLSCIDNIASVNEEKGITNNSDEISEFNLDVDDCLDEEAIIHTRNTLISCGLDLEEEERKELSYFNKNSKRLPCFQNLTSNINKPR